MKSSKNKIDLETYRHSLSHVLAMAVLELYPSAKLGIGPAIENGFYYDFDFSFAENADLRGNKTISDKDLIKIEQKMRQIIDKGLEFKQDKLTREEAIKEMKLAGQNYKVELINDLPKSEDITFYQTGEFEDLCKGLHIKSTKDINQKSFKLMSVAGAYWKGDEKNPQMTRIYGVGFETEKELASYLKLLEQAEKRDHRKIGKEMDLFSFHEQGPGFVFWHDKGWFVFQKMLEYWRKIHRREGYEEVNTPIMLSESVWKQSGHLKSFADKMYSAKSPDSKELNYRIKPMNCDGGILIYKNSMHSYKDLPLKMGEIGLVHRFESSGEVHGLMRLRQFTQDDAHIYCRDEQVKNEIVKVIDLCFEVYKTFGLTIDHIELSTRPDNSIGSDKVWDTAEKIMKEILKENKIEHRINEGDGAFYGPKFDFHLRDAIGRTWQCGTIQLDFAQPENFDLFYIDEKGKKKRPIMIHRVIYGAIERFLGIFIENIAGEFPVWLAPEQVRIIPVSNKHNKVASDFAGELKSCEIRVGIDGENETVGNRIRLAEGQKIPYIIVYGDKEAEGGKLAVRVRGQKDLESMTKDELIEEIAENNEPKLIRGLGK